MILLIHMLPFWFHNLYASSKYLSLKQTSLGKQCRPSSDCSSVIRVCTVCHSLCMFWTSMLKPHFSNFRIITASFWMSKVLRFFTVGLYSSLIYFMPYISIISSRSWSLEVTWYNRMSEVTLWRYTDSLPGRSSPIPQLSQCGPGVQTH